MSTEIEDENIYENVVPNSEFVIVNGCTFRKVNRDIKYILSFTLKKVGILTIPGKPVETVYHLKSHDPLNDGTMLCRLARLVSRDFDSRKAFYDSITTFGKGMKIHVDTIVNAQILSDFYRHLETHGDEELKIYRMADIIGVIEDTLVLSNDMQIRGGRLVPQMDVGFLICNELEPYSLEVNETLISDEGYLNYIIVR
ncbi:uncharacterized protein [Clytia hemisphaerica]|uniref:uncharacterized protein n=1 Tax=Clytia hemisphaerica TaxID=252671 RepID=UPI0034D6517C